MSKSADWLSVAGSWSAIGTLSLGVLAFLRGTSRTKIRLREVLTYPWGSPFPLGRKTLERDLRQGVFLQQQQGDGVYGEDFFVAVIVRVNRLGARPLNVEFVELFDTKRRQPILRAKGASGETVRTIEAHDHFEWRFDFDEARKYLDAHYPNRAFPRVRVRVIRGGGQPLRFHRLGISGKRLLELAQVSEKVLGELPARR
jgi:hypothetical protein